MSDRATSEVRVFAVEDNPGDVRLIEEGIAETDVPVELVTCPNGKAATERLRAVAETRNDHPDLLLLDLNLPGKSGLTVLGTVRDEPRFDDVPVVVVSSSTNPEDIRDAYEQSANAYVTKPTDPDDYIHMIAAVIRFWAPTTHAEK